MVRDAQCAKRARRPGRGRHCCKRCTGLLCNGWRAGVRDGSAQETVATATAQLTITDDRAEIRAAQSGGATAQGGSAQQMDPRRCKRPAQMDGAEQRGGDPRRRRRRKWICDGSATLPAGTTAPQKPMAQMDAQKPAGTAVEGGRDGADGWHRVAGRGAEIRVGDGRPRRIRAAACGDGGRGWPRRRLRMGEAASPRRRLRMGEAATVAKRLGKP
jgi:hypothetical protein